MKKILIFSIWFIFINCHAQKPFTNLNESINNFINNPVLEGARYGISVRDIKKGKEIISINSNDNLTPASNLKILYTLAAYDKFGKNYHFETKLFYSGKINNGILYGNLIFQPDGDPTFAALRFKKDLNSIINKIITKIKEKGIRKINGKIIMELNGQRYPAAGSWPIEDIGNYYGTGAWEFNFRDNRIDVYLQRSEQKGQSTKVLFTVPDIPGIKYISKVITAEKNTDDESYVYGAPFDNTFIILGTIPAGKKPFKVKAGIPNPPLSFLKYFKKKLMDKNIDSYNIQIVYEQNGYRNIIWKNKSPNMLDIIKKTNNFSMNHYSEALGWLLIQNNSPTNSYMNKDSINNFFKNNYSLKHIDLEDASGLAPDNLISVGEMSYFIRNMTKKIGLKTVLDILPHGGEEGYAKYFLQNSKIQNYVWIKSGSVSKVRNYSGIFKSISGKYYSFSIFTNFFIGKHKDVKKAIEKLIKNFIYKL